MMDPDTAVVATIGAITGALEPNVPLAIPITVRNVGKHVDMFTPTVEGAFATCSEFLPPSINLVPGGEAILQVIVTLRDPATLPAGAHPLTVRVAPSKQPDTGCRDQRPLVVAPFADLSLSVSPRAARGVKKANQTVTVTNRGNEVQHVTLSAQQEFDDLVIAFDRGGVVVDRGSAAQVSCSVRPASQRANGGESSRHRYTYRARAVSGAQAATEATFTVVKPSRRWLLVTLLLLATLCGIGAASAWCYSTDCLEGDPEDEDTVAAAPTPLVQSDDPDVPSPEELAAETWPRQVTVEAGFVRVRDEPHLSAEVVATLEGRESKRLRVTGEQREGWYLVGFDDTNGWIFGAFLTPAEPGYTVVRTLDEEALRLRDSEGYFIDAENESGSFALVIDRGGNLWDILRADGTVSYINSAEVKILG